MPVVTGVSELSGVLPRASQEGYGREQPSPEACCGAGVHAGGAEPLLGGLTGGLLRPRHTHRTATADPPSRY